MKVLALLRSEQLPTNLLTLKIGISRQSPPPPRIDVNPLSQIRMTDQVLYGLITSSKFSIIDVSIYDNVSTPIISGEYVHSQTFQLDIPPPLDFVKNSFHPTSQSISTLYHVQIYAELWSHTREPVRHFLRTR